MKWRDRARAHEIRHVESCLFLREFEVRFSLFGCTLSFLSTKKERTFTSMNHADRNGLRCHRLTKTSHSSAHSNPLALTRDSASLSVRKMLPLPVAAPTHTVSSTPALSTYSLPRSPKHTAAGSSTGPRGTEHTQPRARHLESTGRSIQSFHTGLSDSTRGVYDYPQPSPVNINSKSRNQPVTVPYEVMYHYLRKDVYDWFRDRNLDADLIADKVRWCATKNANTVCANSSTVRRNRKAQRDLQG